MRKNPLIGVLGGMGPLATVDFMHKLVQDMPAARDQEHVPVVVWNVPQVPDRQNFLAGGKVSPLPAMLEGVERLVAAGATRLVIPCNTAHHWFDDLAASTPVPFIHIAEATLAAIRAAGKWEFMHGLVANPKPNPDCAESGCGLDALYQKAIPLAVRLVTEYVDGLSTDAPLDAAYQHTFGEN